MGRQCRRSLEKNKSQIIIFCVISRMYLRLNIWLITDVQRTSAKPWSSASHCVLSKHQDEFFLHVILEGSEVLTLVKGDAVSWMSIILKALK